MPCCAAVCCTELGTLVLFNRGLQFADLSPLLKWCSLEAAILILIYLYTCSQVHQHALYGWGGHQVKSRPVYVVVVGSSDLFLVWVRSSSSKSICWWCFSDWVFADDAFRLSICWWCSSYWVLVDGAPHTEYLLMVLLILSICWWCRRVQCTCIASFVGAAQGHICVYIIRFDCISCQCLAHCETSANAHITSLILYPCARVPMNGCFTCLPNFSSRLTCIHFGTQMYLYLESGMLRANHFMHSFELVLMFRFVFTNKRVACIIMFSCFAIGQCNAVVFTVKPPTTTIVVTPPGSLVHHDMYCW
jgi:hypothetical protein